MHLFSFRTAAAGSSPLLALRWRTLFTLRLLAALAMVQLWIVASPTLAHAQLLNWSEDIGSAAVAGSDSYDPNTATHHLSGAGAGFSGAGDAFHFINYQAVSGDGQITVRLSAIDASAQAALVLRESLDLSGSVTSSAPTLPSTDKTGPRWAATRWFLAMPPSMPDWRWQAAGPLQARRASTTWPPAFCPPRA